MRDKIKVVTKLIVPVTDNGQNKLQKEVGVLSQFQRLQSVLAEPQPGAVQHGGKYVELEARLMAGRDRENGR